MSSYLGSKKCCDGNYYQKVIGPQGYQGNQGPIGPVGNQGETGTQGPQGVTGACCRGPQGFQGFQGSNNGITGPQGPQGFQGFQGSNTGITGPQGSQGFQGLSSLSSSSITYYFDTINGLDLGPGIYGTGIPGSLGTKNVYYNLTIGTNYRNGALLYPMDNYFNVVSTGDDPLRGPPPSLLGNGNMIDTKCFMAYVAPYDGNIVSINVNSAFSTTYYDQAQFDFIIMDSTGNINAGQTVWSIPYIVGRQMSGWSNNFNGVTSFKAGDLIYCYIVDTNNNNWGNDLLPFPDNGIFNITLYLKFI